WGLRKSRNATSLNSRFKSLDTLKVKIISVTFRRVIRTNQDRKSGSAGMPRPISYAVFCLKKKKNQNIGARMLVEDHHQLRPHLQRNFPLKHPHQFTTNLLCIFFFK